MSAQLPLYLDFEAVPSSLRRETTMTSGFAAPGVRDPEHPCGAFAPGVPDPSGDCESDGHYLCTECSHLRLCPDGCGERATQCTCVQLELWPGGPWDVPAVLRPATGAGAKS